MPTAESARSPLPLIAPRPKSSGDRRSGQGEHAVAFFQRIKEGAKERRSFRDRRATPRVSVALEWEEQVGDARLVRLTSDLSTFGLATREGPAHEKGTRMRVRLFLPDEPRAPLTLEAVVVGTCGRGRGVRLSFLRPTAEAARRIHRYLKDQTTT